MMWGKRPFVTIDLPVIKIEWLVYIDSMRMESAE